MKRFLLAAVITFCAVELLGISLSVAVLLAFIYANGEDGWIFDWYTADDFSQIALLGIYVTGIPAGIYSLIVAGVFSRARWSRRLLPTMGFSSGLTVLVFAIGWFFIRDSILREFRPYSEEVALTLLAISVGTAAGGAWILHRYFRIVERNDR